jgi:hypothetical protein
MTAPSILNIKNWEYINLYNWNNSWIHEPILVDDILMPRVPEEMTALRYTGYSSLGQYTEVKIANPDNKLNLSIIMRNGFANGNEFDGSICFNLLEDYWEIFLIGQSTGTTYYLDNSDNYDNVDNPEDYIFDDEDVIRFKLINNKLDTVISLYKNNKLVVEIPIDNNIEESEADSIGKEIILFFGTVDNSSDSGIYWVRVGTNLGTPISEGDPSYNFGSFGLF